MRMSRVLRLVAAGAFAAGIIIGCGESTEVTLGNAEQRIEALEAKGVPPTELSLAKRNLFAARDNIEKRNNAKAKENIATLQAELEKAERFYNENVASLGPKIEAAKKTLIEAKNELEGFQERKVDSVLALIDSFMKVDRPMQADNAAQSLIAALPGLREDEATARRLWREIIGTWVFEDKVESVEINPRDAAVIRKEFTFDNKGNARFVESKKGQSNPVFKEDWLFRSWGTFDLKGDTIMIAVDRFKAERQSFEKLDQSTNRWIREPAPTYDSAITDGSQDRFITYQALRDDFRRRR